MMKIGRLQLVLDENPAVVPCASHDIRPEGADMHLCALALQFETDSGCEMMQVLGEPRREVVRLVVPSLAQINRIQ